MEGHIFPRSSAFSIFLTLEEKKELEARVRKYTSPYRDVMRAKIVLLAAEGLPNDVIAARLDTPRQIVSKWRKRFPLVLAGPVVPDSVIPGPVVPGSVVPGPVLPG